MQERDSGIDGDLRDADLVTDLERRDVDLDHVRDVGRLRLDGEAEDQLLDQATVAAPGCLTDEVQRDLGLDRDVAADAHEVDVDEVATGGVSLDLTGERELLVPLDLEADQGVRATLTGEQVRELARRHRDRDRVGVEAVHDGGNLAGAAESPGGAGTALRARFGGELYVGHVARTSSG